MPAIWIGTTEKEATLVAYLSPDDPGSGQFSIDAGGEYDPDFLDAGPRDQLLPVAELLAEIADTHNLGADDRSRLTNVAARRGITVADTHIVLEQDAQDTEPLA